MRFARVVFYFEALTNLGSALFALFAPARFVGQFATESLSVGSAEFGRWYGVLLLVLSLILWSALREGTDRFLRPIIAVFLIGDAVQIAVAVQLGLATGLFSFAVNAAIWTSVFYAIVRIYYLFNTRGLA